MGGASAFQADEDGFESHRPLHYNSNDFKEAFWIWFDSLSAKEKERFWYYGLDMSEIYFYNKHYSKVHNNVFIQRISPISPTGRGA